METLKNCDNSSFILLNSLSFNIFFPPKTADQSSLIVIGKTTKDNTLQSTLDSINFIVLAIWFISSKGLIHKITISGRVPAKKSY